MKMPALGYRLRDPGIMLAVHTLGQSEVSCPQMQAAGRKEVGLHSPFPM